MFLRIVFTLTNSVDPDEMPCYAAFHLDIHYLSKYLLRVYQFTKGFYGSRLMSYFADHVAMITTNSK